MSSGNDVEVVPFVRKSKAEKRRLKFERKKAARAAQHKRLKVKRQQKRAEGYSRMTEAEKVAEREERQRSESATYAHLEKCFHEGQRVAIDLSFSAGSFPPSLSAPHSSHRDNDGTNTTAASPTQVQPLNNERETSSLATQLMHLYASMRRRECCLALHLVSYNGPAAVRLDHHGAQSWRVHRHAGSVAEVFCGVAAAAVGTTARAAETETDPIPHLSTSAKQFLPGSGGVESGTSLLMSASSSSSARAVQVQPRLPLAAAEVCYLTPDADEELLSVDPRVVYVVGGIVDRTVKKGVFKARAEALGFRTARLPLRFLGMKAQRFVLNVDTVAKIIGSYAAHGGDWAATLASAVPQRHREQAGLIDADGEGVARMPASGCASNLTEAVAMAKTAVSTHGNGGHKKPRAEALPPFSKTIKEDI